MEIDKYHWWLKFSVVLLSCHFSAHGKPHGKHGPCKDPMDCLHGVLMHDDKETGDAHTTEDIYNKLKPVLDTGVKPKAGPKDAAQGLHEILMHDGNDASSEHHDKKAAIKPDRPSKQQNPKDISEYMHGVLMHGDEHPGQDHNEGHGKKVKVTGSPRPKDADEIMHGILMHGDADFKHETKDEEMDKNIAAKGPEELEKMMHSFMHNGEHVVHDLKSHKAEAASIETHVLKIGPEIHRDLHGILMHGDSEIGQDHSKEHALHKNKPFNFDKKAIRDLNLDKSILKSAGLEYRIDDKDDYEEWKKEKKDEPNPNGSSMKFVSDSVLSDISEMKKRYLAKARKIDLGGEGITVEEAIEHLDLSAHKHDNGDSEHFKELIGNTEPINDRHKHRKT